ncbi:MAG: hypothetical protein WC683_10140 [bacterium]
MNVTLPMQELPVSDIIGRTASTFETLNLYTYRTSVDWTKADHRFWDRLRWGHERGYELGGLHAQAINRITASWVLGAGVDAELDTETESPAADYTNDLLRRFFSVYLNLMLTTYEDSLGLGDSFLIVNQSDASLTMVPPDLVTIQTDPIDYRQVIAYQIDSQPATGVMVRDIYTAEKRDLTITIGNEVSNFVFPNLIGRIPVVHFANDRAANEIWGRPQVSALLALFGEYNDVIEKALGGVKRMSNPVATFEGVDNPQQVLKANSTRTEDYTDPDGDTQTYYVIDWARQAVIAVGGNGSFNFKGPSPFTDDARRMLEILFLLMLQRSQIPEWVWGGAIASSKASVDAQLPAFVHFVEGRRHMLSGRAADDILGVTAEGGLYSLADIWLRTRALTDPQVMLAPIHLAFPPITEEDLELRLKQVQFAYQENLLQRATTLGLLDLVENPEAEAAKALDEDDLMFARGQERQSAFLDNAMARAKRNEDDGPPPADDTDDEED